MKNEIDCPIDLVSVNENRVKLVALLVLGFAIAYLFTGWWGIIVFLVADFGLRSFNLGKYSPLFIVAGTLVKIFGIGNKPTDQAPKRFAARMGFAFTLVISVFAFLQLTTLVIILGIALCFFAFLESFLGICVGCYVYSFSHKLLRK
jgi:4-hydroxybenzoate polyprenyltransferase